MEDKDSANIIGNLRSKVSGGVIYPELEWEFLSITIPTCTTAPDRYKCP